jgi:manganese/zinc/iron transport system permease protein
VSYLTLIVVIGTSLLGSVAGVLGSFAVLRRRALVGDLLSHAALPGLCLAFLVLGSRQFVGMLVGALLTGLLGVATITFIARWTRTKDDAALGIVLSTFFGLGIVLSSLIQNMAGGGSKAGLETYIYGQAAGMVLGDVLLMAGVSAAALVVLAVFYKEFKLLSFDPGFARAQGWPTLALDMTMMGLLAVVTVIGLPAVGVVLMAAMLVMPGAAARFWTHRLGQMLLLAAAIGALMGTVGTLISAGAVDAWLGFHVLGEEWSSLPTGPVIVLCGTAMFLFSVLFAPQRGALARAWQGLRLRVRTAEENLLRTLFERSEVRRAQMAVVPPEELLRARAWNRARAGWIIARAARRGLVRRLPAGVQLTETGLAEAQRLARIHRLWELFLIEGAQIAPDHVDRDADSIEHMLTPQLVEKLEARLAEHDARDARAALDSPHAVDGDPPGGMQHG